MSNGNASTIALAAGGLVFVGALGLYMMSGGDDPGKERKPVAAQRAKASPNPTKKPKKPAAPRTGGAPNVLMVVVGGLRSDRVSGCGYERPTTPNFDKLMGEKKAVSTCGAVSPGTWSVPSHGSFFTGVGPTRHRAHSITSGIDGYKTAKERIRRLHDDETTLAESFQGQGYQTYLLSGDPEITEESGLIQGFGVHRVAVDWGKLQGDRFPGVFEKMLARGDHSKPLFMAVNIADAHRPWDKVPEGLEWLPKTDGVGFEKVDPEGNYQRYIKGDMTAPEVKAFEESSNNLYDYAIHRADKNLGFAVEHFRDQGWCKPGCRIVVVSDHGEMLGEHGLIDHGHTVWEENVRVPMLVTGKHEVEALPDPVNGRVAYRLAKDGTLPEARVLTVAWPHVRRCAHTAGNYGCGLEAALWDGTDKIVYRDEAYVKFDLSADPGEGSPIALSEEDELRLELESIVGKAIKDQSDGKKTPVLEMVKEAGFVD